MHVHVLHLYACAYKPYAHKYAYAHALHMRAPQRVLSLATVLSLRVKASEHHVETVAAEHLVMVRVRLWIRLRVRGRGRGRGRGRVRVRVRVMVRG